MLRYALPFLLLLIAVSCQPTRDEVLPPAPFPDVNDHSPRWSPDGRLIAYASLHNGNYDIFVMNADGSNIHLLTTDPAEDSQPYWSPDGSKIAFRSERDGNSELYVMNADGSNQARLTDNPAFDGEIPAFSPDGSKIAFVSDRDGDAEVYIMDADGANPTQITFNEVQDMNPSWSPDGQHVVFASMRDGTRDIYTMRTDGTEVVQLTNHDAYDGYATWSPSGNKIAFISFRDEGWGGEIYVMNSDGSAQTRLTHSRDWDFDPAWSPDGTQLVFNSRRDGRRGIYVMNADGSGQTKLTNHALSPFIEFVKREGVDAAMHRYEQALTVRPDTTYFLEAEVSNLAYAMLETQPDDAITLFTLNTRAFPASSNAFLTLGDVHASLQHKEEAVAAYQQALELNPDSEQTLAQLRQAQAD